MTEERHTVLVVDDDPEIIDVLKDHFKKRNCETIATQDPVTVVNKLKSIAVKLMLLDIKMRQLDGFDVLDKIKQAGLQVPPTIIITGYLPKYADKLEAYGIDLSDVITKPFNFEVMEAAINRKLGDQIVSSEVGSEYEDELYRGNRCRIGFVDDEEDLLTFFREFFEERHYQVSCYRNGNEAVEGLSKNPVDILLVDMKLPGKQGDQIIEELSKSGKAPYMIPVSADPLFDDLKKRLRDYGCREFISKPLDIIELIELIKTIAARKGLLG